MSYEPKIIAYHPDTFPQEWKQLSLQGWRLIQIHSDRVYLDREVKKTREQKKAIQTKEYLEFRELYPSKTGIYSDIFINKYNELVKEGLHKEILEAVERYKIELKVTGKPEANASTWITQKRWLEKFKVVKNEEDSWMNELFIGLDAETIKLVKQKISDRRAEHKPCERANIEQIIDYYNSDLFKSKK